MVQKSLKFNCIIPSCLLLPVITSIRVAFPSLRCIVFDIELKILRFTEITTALLLSNFFIEFHVLFMSIFTFSIQLFFHVATHRYHEHYHRHHMHYHCYHEHYHRHHMHYHCYHEHYHRHHMHYHCYYEHYHRHHMHYRMDRLASIESTQK